MGTAGAPNHYFAESPPGKIWDPHQSVRGRNVYCGKAPIWVCFLFLLLFFFFSFLFSWEASMNCWLMKIGRDSYHVHFTDENTEAKKKDTQYVQDQNPVTGRAKTELMYWALKFVLFWVFFFLSHHHVHVFVALSTFSRTDIILHQFQHLQQRGKSLLFSWIFGNKIHNSLPFVFPGCTRELPTPEDATECVQEPFFCNYLLFIISYYNHIRLKRELVTNNLANYLKA